MNESRICDISRFLTKSAIFTVPNFLMFVLSIISIPLNSTVIAALRKVPKLDLNAKYLLINLSFACILIALNLTATTAQTIWNGYILGDPCLLQMSKATCVAINIPAVAGANVVVFSLIGIGLERSYATKFARSYSNSEPNKLVGASLVLLVWLLATISPTLYILNAAQQPANSTSLVPYCSIVLTRSREKTMPVTVNFLLSESAAIVIYVAVLAINRKVLASWLLDRARYSLNRRVQLQRNIDTTEMMLAIVAVHAFCLFPVILSIPLLRFYMDMSEEWRIILFMPFYSLVPIHSVLHPLACYSRFEPLRKETRKMVESLGGAKIAPIMIDTAPAKHEAPGESELKEMEMQAQVRRKAHFDHLDKLWTLKPP